MGQSKLSHTTEKCTRAVLTDRVRGCQLTAGVTMRRLRASDPGGSMLATPRRGCAVSRPARNADWGEFKSAESRDFPIYFEVGNTHSVWETIFT